MTARLLFAPEVKVLFTAKASIATATTTTFGANLNLAATAAFVSGMRLLVVFDGVITAGAGTTDSTGYVINDAPDSSGSIGATAAVPAANIAFSAGGNTLAAGLGDRQVLASVLMQPGRPWLQLQVTRASGTTDTLWTKASILGIPAGLI